MEGLLGIDVSHHEKAVDWHAVAAAGFHFGYAKATEGGRTVDSTFRFNWDAIREAGLLRGAYHFAHPGGEPEAQAAFFASVVGPPSWGELPPVLDLETDDGRPAADVIDWAVRFVQAAESSLGRPLMIYTGGLWRRRLGNPQVEALSGHALWTARYGPHQPVVPSTWTRWDFWQFTDGQNGEVVRVPGVRGKCDVNRFRGDATELQGLVDQRLPSAPPVATAPGSLPAWPGRSFVYPAMPPVRGDDVLRWQAKLKEQGYSVDLDGIYGPQSKRTCEAFQRDAGLDPDGIVGPRTWSSTFGSANS